jgi:hypothetical protein
MNVSRLLTFGILPMLVPATALAGVNTPPYGPGTEARPATGRYSAHIVEGVQASAQLGSGFTDPYGFGIGGRLGYTFLHGVYFGAAVSHYFGKSVDTAFGSESEGATFLGGELGYELYPTYRWEVRPYAFLGPSWITTVGPFGSTTTTDLAFQPGLLLAYHFGNAFVSAEGKVHVTPEPVALTLFAGAGLGFD